jgi:hypothetical protein
MVPEASTAEGMQATRNLQVNSLKQAAGLVQAGPVTAQERGPVAVLPGLTPREVALAAGGAIAAGAAMQRPASGSPSDPVHEARHGMGGATQGGVSAAAVAPTLVRKPELSELKLPGGVLAERHAITAPSTTRSFNAESPWAEDAADVGVAGSHTVFVGGGVIPLPPPPCIFH